MNRHATDEVAEPQVAVRVAEQLRTEMVRQGRSGVELAAVLGVSAHTVGRRLSGETPLTMTELAAACHWLSISIVDLIRRAESVEVTA